SIAIKASCHSIPSRASGGSSSRPLRTCKRHFRFMLIYRQAMHSCATPPGFIFASQCHSSLTWVLLEESQPSPLRKEILGSCLPLESPRQAPGGARLNSMPPLRSLHAFLLSNARTTLLRCRYSYSAELRLTQW